MTDPRPRSLWRGRLLALVGVVLVAFSLRSAVAALSPIISEVQADFAVPTWVAGLIGTAPPVCFAVFGIVTPILERRFGLERLAAASMLIVTSALIARSLAGDAATLLLATTVLFAAVGVGNVVLPPLIKTYFPDRVGTMTALYSALLAMAAFVPPLVAVPVADAAGWRFSLGMWAILALLAVVPWVTLVARANVARAQAPVTVDLDAPAPGVLGRLPRLALAWALAGTFGISAASVYACFAWLPVVLVDIAGVSHAEAGALLSLFGAMGLPWSIIVPILITRSRRVGVVYAAALIAGLTGVAGMLIAPAAATILWVVLLGTPQALFPAVLVLIQLRSRTHEGSVALSGFAQSVGYGIAALFPLMFAVVHELTGQWQPVLIVFGLLFLATIPTGLIVTRPRTIEDEWEHRHGTW
ncbi:MFS transporter [Microbacterium laevaniformans]|uniref:Putative transporter YycB n=1 Tax=Microbacterium laevaniformans TaxID=36807 RepID=A0A150HIU5_9MICO|nr:MFS transporter [Microbacterium laevaniformans]KXZ61924.1 putative transporter YycB [Microbacterium laevaniformans]MBM7751321.1 CP family cyanate transporter-like MFS transporter [Microbacterium laevaniformans]GLJ63482.1 putative MFS transporter [Microbacterium laevaniformans]